jgi:opacity protein-like surface antigen
MDRSIVSFGALGAALALFATSPALAQSDDYARNGAYLGLAGSVGIFPELEDDLDDVPGVDADVDTGLGLNARAGYRFHPHIAAEAEFEWVNADIEVSGNDVGDFDTFVGTVNGKAFLLTGRFQPFAMIGIGAMGVRGDGDSGDSGFAARFGGGLDFYITRNFTAAIDASYVLPTGDVDDFDLVSIGWGFGYRF